MEEKALSLVNEDKQGDIFTNISNFELAQRVATALSKSDLVPVSYKGNVSNTLIALDIAYRINASPLMVMQNLNIIHGKPSWSSTFLIAAINNSGKFNSALNFEMKGQGETLSCFAWTVSKDGKRLDGPLVTMQMANAEGWVSKSGSKWKTMPELMIRYRAAAFFSRLFCPEITMGMQTTEEVVDVNRIEHTKEFINPQIIEK